MINTIRILTAVLPFTLLMIIGLVFFADDVPNWYAAPLAAGFIVLSLFIWRGALIGKLWQARSKSGETINYWQKLRLRMLMALTALALLSTVLNMSFGDFRAADHASSAAIFIGAYRLQNNITLDDPWGCVDRGGSLADCTACLHETPILDLTDTGPSRPRVFGPITVGYSVIDCRTMRIKVDGMTPLSCSLFMQWIDTAWLSQVSIGQQSPISDQLNRDYAALCHDEGAQFTVMLDYTFPTFEAFRETAS